MHLIHYLIGVTYYPVLVASFDTFTPAKGVTWYIFGFLLASGFQSYCHFILGRERAKTQLLPKPIQNPIFRFLHAPHYFAEFCIYFFVAASGSFPLLSLLNLGWIASMLGVSAFNSANWLCQTWKLKSRRELCHSLMFPFIF